MKRKFDVLKSNYWVSLIGNTFFIAVVIYKLHVDGETYTIGQIIAWSFVGVYAIVGIFWNQYRLFKIKMKELESE
ncbi:membrane protein [Arthrobacter phage Kardesai]|uniref:Membrane protein n=1 Tax=Arthrobacter phage Kardesai TaxID=2859474 RepID=A0AAE7VHM9_9CAUD|nr:membrane protein [Arthrobacter phage Kardesai]QXO12999.1 membrane protein [Arthrobacter phage Kardesai]WBF79138.1 hypothetical protein SEA_HANKLY_94 [Arthrobacter phage Hankly]